MPAPAGVGRHRLNRTVRPIEIIRACAVDEIHSQPLSSGPLGSALSSAQAPSKRARTTRKVGTNEEDTSGVSRRCGRIHGVLNGSKKRKDVAKRAKKAMRSSFATSIALLRFRRIESASGSRGVDQAGDEQENADHQTGPGHDSRGSASR